jgi:type IV pilus assembly protein PilB
MTQFHDETTNIRIADLRKRGEERLIQSQAAQLGIPYIDLHGYTINPDALSKIPEIAARTAHTVAFALLRGNLSVATTTPNDPATKALLTQLEANKFSITLHLCSTASLEHGHKRYADLRTTVASKRGILDINSDDLTKLAASIKAVSEVANAYTRIGTINGPRRISETLELIFAGALALRASDIHIEPEPLTIRLRYRLDGVLLDIFEIDTHLYGRIISRLKLLAGMTLNQKKEAQDGRFQFTFGERDIEVRASLIPGSSGESMVMRLLDPGVASFSMDKLALNPFLAEVMAEQLKRPNGLIITTGPTGSGKTTALYAFLRAVHDSEKKIITLENPVEYKLDGIVQTQIGPDYSFSSGLRAILRQDPDIIMVGEVRDREVAETAIHAAQTGHLVFTTLHTNNAAGGFPRLIDLGVDPRIIGSAVNIMLGQRLVRVLCTACTTKRTATEAEHKLLSGILEHYPEPVTLENPLMLPQAVGCEACGGTGYRGRVGVFEAIVVDDAVEEIVIRDPREYMITEAARSQRIPNMAEDGVIKVLAGMTTLDELERVVDLSSYKRRPNSIETPTSSLLDPEADPEIDDDLFRRHIV